LHSAGHRGDIAREGHNSLDTLTAQAKALEAYGWKGALFGTGWGRPDTFTVAAALTARHEFRAAYRHPPRLLAPGAFRLRRRDTTEQAWSGAEAKLAEMARQQGAGWYEHRRSAAVGQQRLLALHERGDVLDDNLYTAPGKFGGGGAGTTWLVGSAADVARSLRKYQDLGISHFVLSDTPYLAEIKRQGSQLLPLLR